MADQLQTPGSGADFPLGQAENLPRASTLPADPTGQFPPVEIWSLPATNITQLAFSENTLKSYGTGGAGIDPAVSMAQSYQFTDANVTASGHVIEYSDQPGGERVLIKHASGAGVDMLPDGSIVVSAANKHILTVAADQTIVIHGDVSYQVKGDFNLDVVGDFNVNCLNHNINVQQDKLETVGNASRSTIGGNHATTVKGSQANTVLGSKAETIVGNSTSATAGTTTLLSQGDMLVSGGGNTKLTSQSGFDISGSNVNIAGNSTSVIGATGTMGGAGVVMYGKGASYGEGVTAPTFNGDLTGTANLARQADVTNSQNYPSNEGGTAAGYTVTNTATPTTAQPTAGLLSQYLNTSDKGIVQVTVDGEEITRMLDKTFDTGGLSKAALNTAEVRRRLRDPANRENGIFVGGQVGQGTLSPDYAATVPPFVGRVASQSPTIVGGTSYIGNVVAGETTRVHRPAPPPTSRRFVPDLALVIKDDATITASTQLSQHYRLATFTGKYGLNHVQSAPERRQIARNLQLHAHHMENYLAGINGTLAGYTLNVVEGVYKEGPDEQVTTGEILDLAKVGRAVVYELVDNQTGQIDNQGTYDLAVYWKDVLLYEKLILDYDNYDPGGSLNVQLIITIPQIRSQFKSTFNRQIETRYNNAVVANKDLVEVTIDPAGNVAVGDIGNSATANTVAAGYPSDMSQGEIERIIAREASLRGIDPSVAVRIFRAEGATSYQSQIPRSGSGVVGGFEASWGPFQLFTGGGLGNEYQRRTGRTLRNDNTRDGIVNQIRFALDQAAVVGWQPWSGRFPAGVGITDGVRGARPVNNWA